VVAKHNNTPGLTKEYNLGTALADMVTDGFTTYDPAYRAVNALASNTPKPRKVIVGKLLTDFNQTFDITVKTVTALGGEVYSFDVVSPAGLVTAVSVTADPADDEDAIAGDLQTAITAITGITATVLANVVSCSADNASEHWYVTGLDQNIMDFEDDTPDSGLAAEIGNIAAENNDWYEITLADAQSDARVTVVATYVETLEKIFGATSANTNILDSGSTTDIGYTLNASGRLRSFVLYSQDQIGYGASNWAGGRLPLDPGSQTWAYKGLSGVLADNLQNSQSSAALAKKSNIYTTIAGLGVTQNGTMAGGEFIDVIRGRDWLTQRLREDIFGLLANAPKVPFTDGGIDQVVSIVESVLVEGINVGYLSPDIPEGQDKAYIITAPTAAEVSATDKANRLLPDVDFTAVLAGAIHTIQINGSIQV
jgi:hypothetical protein